MEACLFGSRDLAKSDLAESPWLAARGVMASENVFASVLSDFSSGKSLGVPVGNHSSLLRTWAGGSQLPWAQQVVQGRIKGTCRAAAARPGSGECIPAKIAG